MPSNHSRLAPSAASRWVPCTASVGFIADNWEKLPKQDTTYADEGTDAHALAADILVGKGAARASTSEEMAQHVGGYVDFVESQRFPGAVRHIERRVPLFYLPGDTGTVDAAYVSAEKIVIADLKYGAGVSVQAERNVQLAIYAESLIQELDTIEEIAPETPVEIYIYQPRDRNDPEPVRSWKLTRKELSEFCNQIQASAMTIAAGFVEFNADPDKQCRFCPAKGLCKEYANFGLTSIEELPPSEVADPRSITREQRVKVLQSKRAMVAWLEAIEDQEVADLLNGAPAMGFKMVEGKTNREWSDPDAVEKLLKNYLKREQIFTEKMISPAQSEKLLKSVEVSTRFENKLKSLVTRAEGKPTLVPETDPRPALVLNPAQELENLDII